MPRYNVTVRPIDGNAYSVMGAVRRGLKRAGAGPAELTAYSVEATSGDYHHLLAVSMEWVDLQPTRDYDDDEADEDEDA